MLFLEDKDALYCDLMRLIKNRKNSWFPAFWTEKIWFCKNEWWNGIARITNSKEGEAMSDFFKNELIIEAAYV